MVRSAHVFNRDGFNHQVALQPYPSYFIIARRFHSSRGDQVLVLNGLIDYQISIQLLI